MMRMKFWMGIGKPKNQHSLDNLKYLFGILNKNQTVTENNKDLLIETLRSISEILIWGDQNDSTVFDFFLEKSMITFFLHYMKQKHGRYICVQLLQTLNILFENIRNETSLYFLLSNNHINNIIFHKFDFSDEEVMAYYISFLKTLSLKLNRHSIHFFFNERQSEFPLFVEALKFFDHPEAMVRIAVRTLTLNVFNVQVQSMQTFVKNKTASYYFSNLVWLIRNQLLDLDITVKNTVDHTHRSRLIDLIDEHVDHLNYIQDVYMLNNIGLCHCLTEQLIRRLLVPVYLSSLLAKEKFNIKIRSKSNIQPSMAMFFLTNLFSVVTYEPLLNDLCELIFFINDEKVIEEMCTPVRLTVNRLQECYLSEPKSLVTCLAALNSTNKKEPNLTLKNSKNRSRSTPQFSTLTNSNNLDEKPRKPSKTDSAFIENVANRSLNIKYISNEEPDTKSSINIPSINIEKIEDTGSDDNAAVNNESENEGVGLNLINIEECMSLQIEQVSIRDEINGESTNNNINGDYKNITDDEKYRQIATICEMPTKYGVIFESLMMFLNAQDYSEMHSLLSLSFFYTMINNKGIPRKFIETLEAQGMTDNKFNYGDVFINKLIGIVTKSVEPDFKVRLITLELAISLIKKLTVENKKSYITDFQLACIEQAREQPAFLLRRDFKTEEMFLDMFEHEYQTLNLNEPISIENLLRDWSILYPPTSTPLNGVSYSRRYPCGDTEKLKQTIRIFFLLRDLCLSVTNEVENQLPLTKQEYLVKENDALDLNSSDLIACTVNLKDKKERRFLVIDPIQFILVEPEVKRIGWGVVKFSDLVQDVEVVPDKEDSRSLNITIKKSPSASTGKPAIRLNSVFTFDDHIRCMAAKQHLVRARDRARRMKLEKIAQILDVVTNSSNNNSVNAKNYNGGMNSDSISHISYSLGGGFSSMLGNLNHPGRASHISQTWSAFTNTTSPGHSTLSSPMAALNHSPLIRNQSIPSSVSSNSFSSNALPISPSIIDQTSVDTSENSIQRPKKHSQSFILPQSDYSGLNEENDNVFQSVTDASTEKIQLNLNNLYGKPDKRRTSSAVDALVGYEATNDEPNMLINTSLNDLIVSTILRPLISPVENAVAAATNLSPNKKKESVEFTI